MQRVSKILIIGLIVSGFIFSLSAQAQAQTNPRPTRMDPEGIVDYVLCSMGLGCGSTTTTASNTGATIRTTTSSNQNGGGGGLFGFGSSSRNTRGLIYGATIIKDFSGNEITLVRVPRPDSVPGELKSDEEVYEIVKGKKHLIPTLDIFYEYGFRAEWVQFISQEQLDKYRRIKLIQVQGDKNKIVYYLTDAGLRRRVLNQEIMDSYGDRTQDIIVVSRKEFSYYPDNKFIHLEDAPQFDVYLIDDNIKKYLTPAAIRRMNIRRVQIAPVNETEFKAYEIGKPVAE